MIMHHELRRVGNTAVILAVLLSAVLLSFAPAWADEPTPSDIQRRIRELEDSVQSLKREQQQTETNLEQQKILASVRDDLSLSSADGRFKLGLRGYVQADGRFFVNDNTNLNTNQYLFRRVRPVFEGTVFKNFDFKIMPDFAGSKLVLFDAYVDVNYLTAARLRIGKYKPPIGFERLQSARNLFFAERGLTTNLVPNRDNGVQLFGDVLDGSMSYALGIFDGVPDLANGDGDANDDKDFAGRVFAQPFRNLGVAPIKGLGFGVSGSYGHERGSAGSSQLPAYVSSGQATFFNYVSNASDATKTAIAFGPHSRLSPQGYYFWGPFGVLADYVSSTQRATLGSKVSTFQNDAWQVVGVVALTGESESYDSIVPAQPFDPWQETWGGVELVARYGVLDIDSDAFAKGFADSAKSARQAREWVLGVNWHLNKSVKLVLDYANTDFRGGGTRGDRRSERAILTRVQLAFPS
jgi:phosphate-selective porin OprO/OprP